MMMLEREGKRFLASVGVPVPAGVVVGPAPGSLAVFIPLFCRSAGDFASSSLSEL